MRAWQQICPVSSSFLCIQEELLVFQSVQLFTHQNSWGGLPASFMWNQIPTIIISSLALSAAVYNPMCSLALKKMLPLQHFQLMLYLVFILYSGVNMFCRHLESTFIAKVSLVPLFSIALLKLFFPFFFLFKILVSGFSSNHIYPQGHLFFMHLFIL